MVVIKRGGSDELGQPKQPVPRHRERRCLGHNLFCPGRNVSALRTGQEAFADAIDVGHHIHARRHGMAVILDENGDDPLADQTHHRLGVIIQNDRFLQMEPLERCRHTHAKA
jgi:hypothetical protein